MNYTIDLTPLLQAIIILAAAVITAFVVPWIKSKLSAEQLAKLKVWIKAFVLAAEQTIGSGKGEEKLQYVLNLLKEKGYNVDSDSIIALVESYVKELFNMGTSTSTEETTTENDTTVTTEDTASE